MPQTGQGMIIRHMASKEIANINSSVFFKIEQYLLEEEKPSSMLDPYSQMPEFMESVFSYMNQMRETKQSKQHHPEGNVWIHTMMVVDEAAKIKKQSKNARVLMWSAFLHDIGKPEATRIKKGKITAYNHDQIGAHKAKEILLHTGANEVFIEQVCAMVRWHMQILFVAKNKSFADLQTMKKEVDVNEVALLGMCDRLGRGNVNREEVIADINKFKKAL